MNKRVCHLSSAHRGLDMRIFHKECVSLATAGYDTHLVILATADEVRQASEKGVVVHPLQAPVGRLQRMLRQAWNCYSVARRLNAEIYHFHDPELIPYGILLALSGKKVIYDVHEDVPQDILTKEWIKPWARKFLSKAISAVEYIGAKYFFSIAAATPFIAKRFHKISNRVIDVNNYSLISEFFADEVHWGGKCNQVCYVGGIARIRGILESVEAIGLATSGARLQLAGVFSDSEFEAQVHAQASWQKVDSLGWLNRSEIRFLLNNSIAGLVTLHPVQNYIDSLPVKMFEYMAAGLPVIASNFPLWCEIVQGNDCGICVDPLNPRAIADAIDFLIKNPEQAERMGRNGKRAVAEKYNWGAEEEKLLRLYARL